MPAKLLLSGALTASIVLGAGFSASVAEAGKLAISLSGKLLSAQIDQQPIARVVAAINGLMPDKDIFAGYVIAEAGTTITSRFEALPLQTGLRKLLKGNDYLLDFNATQKPGIRLKLRDTTVTQRRYTPSPSSAQPLPTDEAKRLRQLFDDGDFERLYVELAPAIEHPIEEVREEALQILSLLGDGNVNEQLDRMALYDASPNLRVQALEVSVAQRGPDANPLLSLARTDADPHVSGRASELLTDIERLLENY